MIKFLLMCIPYLACLLCFIFGMLFGGSIILHGAPKMGILVIDDSADEKTVYRIEVTKPFDSLRSFKHVTLDVDVISKAEVTQKLHDL